MVLKSDTDELSLSFSFKINAFPHLRDQEAVGCGAKQRLIRRVRGSSSPASAFRPLSPQSEKSDDDRSFIDDE